MEISADKRAELFSAIAKMQGELTGAFKAKSGHGYNYADLAQCIKTAQEPLKNNGLAIVQLLTEKETGTHLETIMTHSDGGFVSSSFLMAKAVLAGGGAKNPAQTMGSSITYMRRYAYSAIIGLAQTDDDAGVVVSPVKPTADDQTWIDAAKADIKVLEQITDASYRKHIQSFL